MLCCAVLRAAVLMQEQHWALLPALLPLWVLWWLFHSGLLCPHLCSDTGSSESWNGHHISAPKLCFLSPAGLLVVQGMTETM
jgi:hypothetical protein